MKNRMTVAEFCRQNPDDQAYLMSLSKRPSVVQAEMIPFSSPAFLAGPFGERHGLIIIKDCRSEEMKSETETYNDIVTRSANSSYNIPHALKKDVIKDAHTYLMGRSHKKTLKPLPLDEAKDSLFFMTKDSLEGSETRTREHVQTTRASSFEMNCLEFAQIILSMADTMEKADIVKMLKDYEAKTLQSVASRVQEQKAYPTLERPFQVSLMGNDDASWGAAFPDLEAAAAFVSDKGWDRGYAFVQERMIFTN